MSADKMECLWSTGVQGGAQRGGGWREVDEGQEKRKERENREKFFSHLPSPPSHFGYER